MNLERLTERRNNATTFADWLKFQRMIDYLWQRELRIPPPSDTTKSADILIFKNAKNDLEELVAESTQ